MADVASQVERVRLAFEAAAVDPSQWLDALKDLADATGSMRGQLIGIGGAQLIPFNWCTDLPEESTREFIDIGGGSPEINYRVTASERMKVGEVASDSHYRAMMPRLKSDIYLDFCERWDLPYGMQTKLAEGPEGLIGLAMLRSHKDGPATPEQQDLFTRVVGYAQAAVRIQAELASQGAKLVAGTMEAMDLAAFVLDGSAAVRAMTPLAECLLIERKGVRLADGHLIATVPAERPLLDQAIAYALDCEDRHSYRTLLLKTGADGAEPLVLSLMTLPSQPWSMHFRPRVIAVAKRQRARAGRVALLGRAFDLTPAEARVALLIADGKSRAEIAADRGVSVATVLTQIKSIFMKTGVTREGALVARLRDLLD